MKKLLKVFLIRANDQIGIFLQKTIRPAHKRVLFMQNQFKTQMTGSQRNRHRNVVTKTNDQILPLQQSQTGKVSLNQR